MIKINVWVYENLSDEIFDFLLLVLVPQWQLELRREPQRLPWRKCWQHDIILSPRMARGADSERDRRKNEEEEKAVVVQPA